MKVLVIAEAANPDWVSVPLVGWSLANSLRKVVDTHLVTQIRNTAAITKYGLIENQDFTAINSEKFAKPLFEIANFLRGGENKGWTLMTAASALSYYYFEYCVWKQFGEDLKSGKYDLVHRVTPLSPTIPSFLARKCNKHGVKFILGPLNGGVPWPVGFDSSRRKEKEYLSYIRNAYKMMPGYRSTITHSAAIIAGSSYTLGQLPSKFNDKYFYIPENGINPDKFSSRAKPIKDGVLRACFVGRLVPYKGPDMLLEAALPLLTTGKLELDIIGDGPLMHTLKAFVKTHNLENCVSLHGWVEHSLVQDVMINSQVLAFPSIREFGGGVVLEAMALGIVPLVIDYAGPGDLVTQETGYKVALGTRGEIISGVRSGLNNVLSKQSTLPIMAQRCIDLIKQKFYWDVKAQQVAEIYRWTLDNDEPKPKF